ncbi:MAG: hypothetical protein ACYC26_09565 [Phycisphaerales bacterium]
MLLPVEEPGAALEDSLCPGLMVPLGAGPGAGWGSGLGWTGGSGFSGGVGMGLGVGLSPG